MESQESGPQEKLVCEAVREAELYLSAQVTLATSADQRATVMASIFAASGAALVAELIAFVPSAANVMYGSAVFTGGIVAAILFLAGAGLCVWATFPVDFALPGNEPDSWKDDIERSTDFTQTLLDTAEHYQSNIDDNLLVLYRSARIFKWGAIAGIAAPFVGFVAWLLAYLCVAHL